uniref:Uncharacterized protein n=1 Tax=Anguilla anguilla TaxID=7936 RepID=A0A0E9QJH3_ANGAN
MFYGQKVFTIKVYRKKTSKNLSPILV